MIKSNLRFAVSVAKNYQNQGIKLDDLVQEGNLGLVKAASRFDEEKGFPSNSTMPEALQGSHSNPMILD